MTDFRKEGEHLKHLDCTEYSPLLLAACITGHDYNDALKILREQKKLADNKVSYFENLNEIPFQSIEHCAYELIGEYLANCGGVDCRDETLLRIRELVLELQKRDRI